MPPFLIFAYSAVLNQPKANLFISSIGVLSQDITFCKQAPVYKPLILFLMFVLKYQFNQELKGVQIVKLSHYTNFTIYPPVEVSLEYV